MTTQEKLTSRKQSLLELAEYLQNISKACKIHGVSRQHFYLLRVGGLTKPTGRNYMGTVRKNP